MKSFVIVLMVLSSALVYTGSAFAQATVQSSQVGVDDQIKNVIAECFGVDVGTISTDSTLVSLWSRGNHKPATFVGFRESLEIPRGFPGAFFLTRDLNSKLGTNFKPSDLDPAGNIKTVADLIQAII